MANKDKKNHRAIRRGQVLSLNKTIQLKNQSQMPVDPALMREG